ncbi:flagellar protein FlgJ [Novosphingobium hassiacum]|uniref:Flagellar protein FlgJ n=1 Tax=Novosphingobium hassiacum TaxID=173676 RepID=A0A7W6A0N8_9SPHN|nr:flagellar biosynthesis protein FlgJ [Novosphingobium hassiacum]MBB3861862.1 flagellar protein FlgJ [Novosphingobium hassiacum]
MSTVAATPAPTLSLKPKVATDREKLSQAAKQFEAIFVRQMLASARATDFGGKGVFGEMDQTFVQMRDDRFAEIASQTGALGLAKQIENHLAAQLRPEAPAAKGK